MRVVQIKDIKSKDLLKSLTKGGVLYPMLGGYCVLALRKEDLIKRFGHAYKVLFQGEPEFKIFQDKPVVIVLEEGNGFSLISSSSVLNDIFPQVSDGLWFSILEEDDLGSDGRFLNTGEKWITLWVKNGENGAGPTVINFCYYPPLVERKGEMGILELDRLIGKKVRIGPDVIFSIVVVCTGNSCRSPIAWGLLKEALKGERVIVSCAGIAPPVGSPPTELAILVAKEMGVDITAHRARRLNREMVEGADLILVMEKRHKERIVEIVPKAEGKIKLLGGYPESEREIPDPIGRPLEVYREVGLLIKAGVLRVVSELKERLKKGD